MKLSPKPPQETVIRLSMCQRIELEAALVSEAKPGPFADRPPPGHAEWPEKGSREDSTRAFLFETL